MKTMIKYSIKIVALVAVALMIWKGYDLLNSPRHARRRPPMRKSLLVDVMNPKTGDYKISIKGMGEIVPSKTSNVTPQVAGKLIHQSESVLPGGIVKKGQQLWEINPIYFKLDLEMKQALLEQALCDLKIEQGKQQVAKAEYEMIKKQLGQNQSELALRQPQLHMCEEVVRSAKAAVNSAKEKLKSTKVHAPFNGIIQERIVGVGARVTENTTLATIYNTDRFRLKIKLPVKKLKWIKIPGYNSETGAKVKITNPNHWGKKFRIGTVERLAGELESQGRLAQLIVKIDDPLCLKPENKKFPKVLLGMYVDAEIEGCVLKNTFRIPRKALREGNRVWLFDNGVLKFANPVIEKTSADWVYITGGIKTTDKLITSNLTVAIENTPLRTEKFNPNSKGSKGHRPDRGPGQGREPGQGRGPGHPGGNRPDPRNKSDKASPQDKSRSHKAKMQD